MDVQNDNALDQHDETAHADAPCRRAASPANEPAHDAIGEITAANNVPAAEPQPEAAPQRRRRRMRRVARRMDGLDRVAADGEPPKPPLEVSKAATAPFAGSDCSIRPDFAVSMIATSREEPYGLSSGFLRVRDVACQLAPLFEAAEKAPGPLAWGPPFTRFARPRPAVSGSWPDTFDDDLRATIQALGLGNRTGPDPALTDSTGAIRLDLVDGRRAVVGRSAQLDWGQLALVWLSDINFQQQLVKPSLLMLAPDLDEAMAWGQLGFPAVPLLGDCYSTTRVRSVAADMRQILDRGAARARGEGPARPVGAFRAIRVVEAPLLLTQPGEPADAWRDQARSLAGPLLTPGRHTLLTLCRWQRSQQTENALRVAREKRDYWSFRRAAAASALADLRAATSAAPDPETSMADARHRLRRALAGGSGTFQHEAAAEFCAIWIATRFPSDQRNTSPRDARVADLNTRHANAAAQVALLEELDDVTSGNWHASDETTADLRRRLADARKKLGEIEYQVAARRRGSVS